MESNFLIKSSWNRTLSVELGIPLLPGPVPPPLEGGIIIPAGPKLISSPLLLQIAEHHPYHQSDSFFHTRRHSLLWDVHDLTRSLAKSFSPFCGAQRNNERVNNGCWSSLSPLTEYIYLTLIILFNFLLFNLKEKRKSTRRIRTTRINRLKDPRFNSTDNL